MADKSVTRKDLGWGACEAPTSNTDRGLVLHYDGGDQHLAAKKDEKGCLAYWLRTREAHIGKGWLDIGYSYGVCPHGYTYTGRGYGDVQAAQRHDVGKLVDGNTRWVSVTLMSGPHETPTDVQVATVKGLRKYLMEEHGMRGRVRYHGMFSDTDCPGPIIIGMVKKGVFL
jgi:hypothetical protein